MILCAVLGVVELCSAASASRGKRQQNNDYYQYGYQPNTHPDYSYSEVENYEVEDEVEPRKCFDCEYTFLASENHHEGNKACMDPFKGEGVVTEVECKWPCAVSYIYLFMIIMFEQ